MFSSKSFIVSGLTFKYSIHFEFIFVYGARECSNVIFSHVPVQFSQYHLLKSLCFLHCRFLPSTVRLGDRSCMGLSLSFLFSSIGPYFCASTVLL